MANLTITIDEATLKKARIRALEQNTSVNRILSQYLEVYAGVSRDQSDSVNKIIALSNASASRREKSPGPGPFGERSRKRQSLAKYTGPARILCCRYEKIGGTASR